MSETASATAATDAVQSGNTTNVVVSEGTHEATGESQSLSPGETLTFDDLDQLVESSKKTDRDKKAKDKEAKPKEEKKADSDGDKDEEAKESKSKEKAKEKKDGEKEEKPKVEAKTRKYKVGDQEGEIDESALITVKVNGKEEAVSVADLLNNYSGKVAWDKRFSEFDKTRKNYEGKVKTIEQRINAVINEKDPEIRMFKMAELSGQSPIALREKFINDNIELLEKYYAMTDDERKADAIAFENRYLKHKAENQEKQFKEQQATRALSERTDKLLASSSVSKQQFVDRYDLIERLVEEGNLSADKVTPEFIVESIVKDDMWSSIDDVIKSEEIQNVSNEMIMKLVNMAYQEGLSKDDVAEMASDLWGAKKAKRTVEEKIKQRETVLKGSDEEVPVAKAKVSEPMFFDDII